MILNKTRIEMLLAERCMTKAALGEKSGISSANISSILRRKNCQPHTVGKLAKGLGVAVEEIIVPEQCGGVNNG